MKIDEIIKKLAEPYAASGCEQNVFSLLKEYLEPFGNVYSDNMNNLFCTFGSGYHILLDAHIDEVGFIVTSVTDDGFLKFSVTGGIDKRMLPATEVVVFGKRMLRGVVSTLPPHLQNDDKRISEISDFAVDIGCNFEEAKELVPLGSRIYFLHRYKRLLGGRICSNCLDDRSGAAALMAALPKLKEIPLKFTLMFSSQEEVGTRGAASGAFGKHVDEAIAVDVSFAMSPGCEKKDCGVLSSGPMVSFSPTLDYKIFNDLKNCAKKAGIAYQTEIMSGRTGTNADVIQLTESGIKCGLISIPLRYMHSPGEVVDVADVENTAALIAAYAKEKAVLLNA